MPQSLKHTALDFSSGHDLTVFISCLESGSVLTACSLLGILSPSLRPSPALSLSLSLSKYINIKNEIKKKLLALWGPLAPHLFIFLGDLDFETYQHQMGVSSRASGCLFIQQTFIECLLSTRPCSRFWRYSNKPETWGLACPELPSVGGAQTTKGHKGSFWGPPIWVAQSVECLTLDFGSGHDLVVCGIGPRVGLDRVTAWDPCLGFSLSVSLCPSPACTHSFSLKINK